MSFLNTSKIVEGGMGDQSNDMDISLVNDGTIIDGVGGAEIGVANMRLIWYVYSVYAVLYTIYIVLYLTLMLTRILQTR